MKVKTASGLYKFAIYLNAGAYPELDMSKTSCGLMPVSGKEPVILILGSFPGLISLEKQEYYGNKNNSFWKIIENLLSIDANLPYGDRIYRLTEKGIALWDVASACSRKGSSDSSIRDVVPNDILSFLREHNSIRVVILNGKSGAGKMFMKIYPDFGLEFKNISLINLPSTSSANAVYTHGEKIREWSVITKYLEKC